MALQKLRNLWFFARPQVLVEFNKVDRWNYSVRMEKRSEQISIFKYSPPLKQRETFMLKVRRKLPTKALYMTIPALMPILCIVHLCDCVSIADCVMGGKNDKKKQWCRRERIGVRGWMKGLGFAVLHHVQIELLFLWDNQLTLPNTPRN